MEDENFTITIPMKEYRRLQGSDIKLQCAKEAVCKVREKDGRLHLDPKCVDMLLEIMEED